MTLVFCSLAAANSKMIRIGIVGAGPAGLTAGHYLTKAGYSNVTVLEKNHEVGGKTQTVEHNGQNYEMGGYHEWPKL